MRNFSQNRRSNAGWGNKRYGGRDSGRRGFRYQDSERPMHKAICDECGKSCEVPFRPSGDKPIYCSSCFENKRYSNSRRPSGMNSGRSNFDEKDNKYEQLKNQFDILNVKLDKILKALTPAAVEESAPKADTRGEIKESLLDKSSKKTATKKN